MNWIGDAVILGLTLVILWSAWQDITEFNKRRD